MPRSTDTRERLLQSATNLIYARSYHDVGVQEICVNAGVKKGSFYHYFPSKQKLTIAVLEHLKDFFQEKVLDRAFKKDVPPLQRIERFFEYSYEVHEQSLHETGFVLGCPFGNLAAELSTLDESLRTTIGAILTHIESCFQDALTDAVNSRDLPPVDINATATAMLAYAEGIMLLAKARNNPAVIRDIGPMAIQLIHP
jgi:TetR/AcrR family transcriptional repressor of nem operon